MSEVVNIQVGLVYGDPDTWLDRQIMNLEPRSPFSHGGFIFHYNDLDPVWIDIHHRWFTSSLRRFPAKNYGWSYRLFDLKDLDDKKIQDISSWVGCQRSRFVFYDFLQAWWQWASHKLGLAQNFNPLDNPYAFQSAEFLMKALSQAGYVIEHTPGYILYSHIVNSGHLVPVREVDPHEQ